jgi:hypothetical protein
VFSHVSARTVCSTFVFVMPKATSKRVRASSPSEEAMNAKSVKVSALPASATAPAGEFVLSVTSASQDGVPFVTKSSLRHRRSKLSAF